MNVRVGVIIASHNRVDQTLAALRALHEQKVADAVDLTTYLLDDASTDGTPQRVVEEFGDVHMLHGDGQLFWNGGMRRAFAAALRDRHDHYLWLNDDTVMDTDALAILLATHRMVSARGERPAIVAGSTRDPDTGELTYGGVQRRMRTRPLRFDLVTPGEAPQQCDTMNGNCVLIPSGVAERVGNLEPGYRHAMGDYDYGLRARAEGCDVWITPGTIATCADNPIPVPGHDRLRDEWRRVHSTKGLPPRDWMVFSRRWAGPLWPLYWVSPYIRRGSALVRERL